MFKSEINSWEELMTKYEVIKKESDNDDFSSYFLEHKESMKKAILWISKNVSVDLKNRVEYFAKSEEKIFVNVIDYFEEGDEFYVITEYFEGNSIKSCVENAGGLYINDSLAIVLRIIEELRKIEKQNNNLVIGLDPDDIFIDGNGSVKIGIGLSKCSPEIEGEVSLSKYLESNASKFNIYNLGQLIIYLCNSFEDSELALWILEVGKDCLSVGIASAYYSVYEVKRDILKNIRKYNKKISIKGRLRGYFCACCIFAIIVYFFIAYFVSFDRAKERAYKVGYEKGLLDARDDVIDNSRLSPFVAIPLTDLTRSFEKKSVMVGDRIYYINNGDIYSINEYGEDMKLLYKAFDARDIYYGGYDWLYCVIGDKVVQVNLYNDQRNLFCEQLNGGNFVCDRGIFYIVYDNEICLINQLTYNIDHLFYAEDKCIYVKNGKFYFYNEEKQTLYETDSMGVTEYSFTEVEVTRLVINEDGLFYRCSESENDIVKLNDLMLMEDPSARSMENLKKIHSDMLYIDSYSQNLNYFHVDSGLVEKITDEEFENVEVFGDVILYYSKNHHGNAICIGIDGKNWHVL